MFGHKQRGLTTVEAAIVSTVAMVILFGVIEVGRALFVYTTLEEVTRRGARMAAVCQLNDAGIREVAIFNQSGTAGASRIIAGLNTANLAVEYLDIAGAAIGNPAANYGAIEFVRVRLQNFTHELFIPFVGQTINFPEFSTTLPRESLGVTRDGLQPC